MISFPRAVDDPRQLPELRAALLDLAADGGAWEQTEIARAVRDIGGPIQKVTTGPGGEYLVQSDQGYDGDELKTALELAFDRGRAGMKWYRRELTPAQLVYVTADMTDVVEAAAAAVPDGLTVEQTDAPAPAGLVVFGRPLYGTDAMTPEKPLRFDGLLWGQSRLPPADVQWETYAEPFTVPAASVAMFRLLEPGVTDSAYAMAQELHFAAGGGPLWLPLGRTDWPWGQAVEVPPRPALLDAPAWPSMMEDRRLLIALWAVLNQRRLVEVSEAVADRPARRRLERAGHGALSPSVRVVHLRRQEYQTVARPEATGRHVKVRFPVRPFWRRQPYGPGRTLRRLVLVPGHWRGPLDAPVVHVEKVWELDR